MSFKNTFGHLFRVHSFGESHGEALGVVIDGCPSGLKIDEKKIKDYLNRRRPGQNSFVTSRKESDEFQILSGIYENESLGTPIAAIFKNNNQNSEVYKNLKHREGHADQAWVEKFNKVDLRGGGRSSGRETVSRVFAGAIARQFLETQNPDLKIQVWIEQIYEIKNRKKIEDFESQFETYKGLNSDLSFPDETQLQDLKKLLTEAKEQGESYGGMIKVRISKLSSGLGQPVFSKLKSDLASALFSIGAVQSVNLGESNVFLKGTDFHSLKNPYGGVQGGLSTSKDIQLKILLKPTSSILDIAKKGRHDPCILPRAVVVIESMVALVLADHFLLKRTDNI